MISSAWHGTLSYLVEQYYCQWFSSFSSGLEVLSSFVLRTERQGNMKWCPQSVLKKSLVDSKWFLQSVLDKLYIIVAKEL